MPPATPEANRNIREKRDTRLLGTAAPAAFALALFLDPSLVGDPVLLGGLSAMNNFAISG
jgi:hypothetical protein